jgi:hypothetical protein
MHSQLNHFIAQQRSADLQDAAARDRLVSGARRPRSAARRPFAIGRRSSLKGRFFGRRAAARV